MMRNGGTESHKHTSGGNMYFDRVTLPPNNNIADQPIITNNIADQPIITMIGIPTKPHFLPTLSLHGTKSKACHNAHDDRPCSSYLLSPPASLINLPSPLHPISRITPHLYHPPRANQRLLPPPLLRHLQTIISTTSNLPCRISVLFVRSCRSHVSSNIFVYLPFCNYL